MPLLHKFMLGDDPPPSEIEEVMLNLNHILNTKKGFGSLLREFGLGDYNAYKSRKAVIDKLMQEILDNIKVYEPRVRVVQLQQVEAEIANRIRFEMKCQILTKSKPLYVTFDSGSTKVVVEED